MRPQGFSTCRETSARGRVELKSPSAFERPRINFESFEPGNADRGAVVEAIEMVRKINKRLGWVEQEVRPGSGTVSAADLGAFVEDNAWGHHASCSCPMGRNPAKGAVVDGEFRVHGVRGLRVVDASVFPRISGLFVVLPTYMIAEKAVDDIDAAHGKPLQVGGS